jgi:hypothetical protein
LRRSGWVNKLSLSRRAIFPAIHIFGTDACLWLLASAGGDLRLQLILLESV